jgi:hypothetical protein
MTLERLIHEMKQRPIGERTGRLLLDLIDKTATDPAALDLGALRDREALGEMDLIEAGCWMGARLAEALAHAHGQKVLHRDIKPANILVNRYGRPMLVDFNIAAAPKAGMLSEQTFGGTLAYMAPEHLDAFNPEDFTPPEAVDARSDIWSLGVVLYELFTGQLPFPLQEYDGTSAEALRQMADLRRAKAPKLAPHVNAPPALERVIARCLAPRPDHRYQSAAELAADLDSCRELHRVQRELPRGHLITQLTKQAPFLVGAILMLLPQLIATVVNIGYNWLLIVGKLPEADRRAFYWLVPIYNTLAYTVLLTIFFSRVVPVYRAWRALHGAGAIDTVAVEAARRQALTVPMWGFALASFGWIFAGLVFPFVLNQQTGSVSLFQFRHLLFSFTISGLIAITYSVLVLEFILVRILYPQLWLDALQMHEIAARELGHEESRMALLQYLAVLIPLAGAALMVGIGPDARAVESYPTFRFLVTGLLALGMTGLGLALLTGSELRQTVSVLVSPGRQR